MVPITQDTQEPFPPPGWITKPEAAKRLNRSESRVSNIEGIRKQLVRHPKSQQFVNLCHEGDVERILYAREHPGEVSRVPAKADKPNPFGVSALSKLFREPDEPAFKPWLTVAEAAGYTGLPKSMIEYLIAVRSLSALDCGPRPGGKYRIKRTDLDAIEGDRK